MMGEKTARRQEQTLENDMNIRFGDWELRSYDKLNWELWHHVTVEGRGANLSDGKPRWRSEGRYYQASTFANAIEFAADWEGRNGSTDKRTELLDYLRSYFERMDAFKDELLDALGEVA